ncbi:MAG TPA: M1 family aminopeptidase, partial [Thermoanaerobaculia bacterium]|nr:M1 family aminopeptidase [Thermoanaerobaculia bacterium]
AGAWRSGARRTGRAAADAPGAVVARDPAITVPPPVRRTFGGRTRARQAIAIAGQSFRHILASWGGLALAALSAIVVLTLPRLLQDMGVALLPTTGLLTAFLGNSQDALWTVIPLLVAFYAGELVWRERETGASEITDVAPVPEWVSFVGRFLGLALLLVTLQALMMASAILVQVRAGYHDFELGLYGRILFGLQLPDHLLFALLALAVHVLVNQKYLGHLAVLVAYAVMAFGAELGIAHDLLVYGADPGWSYSDMRGLEPFVGPWLAFQLYWAGWALLLAVAAVLFWVRGQEPGLRSRLRRARRRFTRPAAATAATAAALVLPLGGFLFYDTEVLDAHQSTAERLEARAEYERRYGRYAGLPQPRLSGTRLRVEIHPDERRVEIRGTYHLVNRSPEAIDSLHLATAPEVETGAVELDRAATLELADDELGHRIYALAEPLQPGESLRLRFAVRFAPRGFANPGPDPAVVANGTYFAQHEWLPALGYRPSRELAGAGNRRAHGLPPRPEVRPLDDAAARHDLTGAERIAFEAIVGTAEGQIAVAPGRLLRTWTQGGRRYFHYVTDAPIRNDYAFFSAAYAVREGRWNDVAIQILHHPGHAGNVERMMRSIHASLDSYTERFGPYPHGQIRLVEHPGAASVLHSYPVNISYREGFSLFDPGDGPEDLDLPFAVVAHEVAHQWWGNRVTPALVEGAPLLTEGLAWYSALGVVEETLGREHLRRLLDAMRAAYLAPRSLAGLPLLRATDRFAGYRRGAFAMYALREYVGAERVDAALRRLLERHGAGEPPLPTSLDLYRELQAVTPEALRPLLADLFAANTSWDLAAQGATAEPSGDGAWRVTLEVAARKVVIDEMGVETEVPMDDLVEVGVFAPAADDDLGEPLHLGLHRVRSGTQRITLTVPGQPARAGVDPRHLLIDPLPADNLHDITPTPGFR